MAHPNSSRYRQPNRLLMEHRINLGLSPNALGYRAGISGKTVRMAEMGFLPSPRVQLAIARVLDLRPTDLWPLDVQERAYA